MMNRNRPIPVKINESANRQINEYTTCTLPLCAPAPLRIFTSSALQNFAKILVMMLVAAGLALSLSTAGLAQSDDSAVLLQSQSPVETPTPVPRPTATPISAELAGPLTPLDSEPLLHIDPTQIQVFTDETGITRVKVSDAGPLQSIDFRITFDPGLIGVVDADPTTSGIQIAVESQLLEQGAEVTRNQADNAAGIIEFKISGLSSVAPVNNLAAITWLGLHAGMADLTLVDVYLSSADGKSMGHSTQNGRIEVMAAPGDSVTGRALLQGRLQHAGAKVFLVELTCEEFMAGNWQNRLEPAAFTDKEGYFKIEPDEKRDYRCLQVVKRGYLNGQAESPDGNLGETTLLGGDVTGDNLINIFDLAYLGTRYGDKSLDIDINGDGIINIFDLVLAASNFGQRGPTENWE